jgi:hypothetical protein
MNCETCQELIHDLVDGSISQRDEFTLNTHLKECLDCESVRQDLASIVGFCRTQRGQYETPPNAPAMWLRIRNVIEAELPSHIANTETKPSFLGRLLGHSWELSLPQLAASAAAIVLVVSLATVVGLRRFGGYGPSAAPPPQIEASNMNERLWKHRQIVDYWNQRIELSKARWSPENRASFEEGLKAYDESFAASLDELKKHPNDEFNQQMVTDIMNDKVNFLKEYGDL